MSSKILMSSIYIIIKYQTNWGVHFLKKNNFQQIFPFF